MMEIEFIDILIASFIMSFAIVFLAKRSILAINKKIERLRYYVDDATARTARTARRHEDKYIFLEQNIERLQRDIEELKSALV